MEALMDTTGKGILARVAEVAGEEAARQLAKTFGGRTIYLPRAPGPDHPLARALGLEAACAVCRELGSGHLSVPKGVRELNAAKRRRVLELSAEGFSAGEIALMLDCTQRTVYRWRSRARQA